MYKLKDKLIEQGDKEKIQSEWRYIQRFNFNSNFIKNFPKF